MVSRDLCKRSRQGYKDPQRIRGYPRISIVLIGLALDIPHQILQLVNLVYVCNMQKRHGHDTQLVP